MRKHFTIYYALLMGSLVLLGCSAQHIRNAEPLADEYDNQLLSATSPYLRLHGHDKVDWQFWENGTFERAEAENKLILLTIGRSTVHSTHVMRKLIFRDSIITNWINENFVPILLDEHERPDVHLLFQQFCKLSNPQSVETPIYAVLLPDGKPLFAAPFTDTEKWINDLESFPLRWRNTPARLRDLANRNVAKLTSSFAIISNGRARLSRQSMSPDLFFNRLAPLLDSRLGGIVGLEKKPKADLYEFLLNYFYLNQSPEIQRSIELGLRNMASGGIYDHLGGGFFRGTRDPAYRLPWFEKPLLVNAKLVHAYTSAWQLSKDPQFEKIVFETLAFVSANLTSEEGGFYLALDADTENEEGRFYSWQMWEISSLLNSMTDFFTIYYNLDRKGNWKDDNNVLFRSLNDKQMAVAHHMTELEVRAEADKARDLLLEAREKRVKPQADDQIIVSANAMMAEAFVMAYRVFDDPQFLDIAIKNVLYILKTCKDEAGLLMHSPTNQPVYSPAFLPDYAQLISACMSLYQATLDTRWLERSQELVAETLNYLYDPETGFFLYAVPEPHMDYVSLFELEDGQSSSSSALMCKNMYELGSLIGNPNFVQLARDMLKNMYPRMMQEPDKYLHWAQIMLKQFEGQAITIFQGGNPVPLRRKLDAYYLPFMLYSNLGDNELYNFYPNQRRSEFSDPLMYYCKTRRCSEPISRPEDLIDYIRSRP